MVAKDKEAYKRLEDCGLRPSVQRLLIMDYLLSHHTHPTVEEVYRDLCKKCPTLSKTTEISDMEHMAVPQLPSGESLDGNVVSEVQLYYKGLCAECAKSE